MMVGQGPIALAVGAGRRSLDISTLLYLFTSLSPSLWKMARYRLKYCLKGPLNNQNNQPTNQLIMNNPGIFLQKKWVSGVIGRNKLNLNHVNITHFN